MTKLKMTMANQGLNNDKIEKTTNPFIFSTAPMRVKKYLFDIVLNIGKFNFSTQIFQISPKVADKIAFFALKYAEQIILTKMLWRVTLVVGFWVWTAIILLKMFL